MGRKNNKLASQHIDFEEENEELNDEVETFHSNDRKLAANAYRKKPAKREEEVLNVEPDESEESEMSESDFDDDDDEDGPDGVTANEWGRKRKDFYGTEYVDEDWGGMRDEELEDAELEEEDAASRQAALDKAAALADDFFEKVDESSASQKKVKETALEWTLPTVKELNRRTSEIIEEYNRRKDLMKVIVNPLIPVTEHLSRTSNVRKQLLLVFDVYSRYMMNLLFYLRLKTESLEKKNASDDAVDSHPVLGRIEKYSKMIRKVDEFLDKNASSLKKLIERAKSGEMCDSLVVEPQSKIVAKDEVGAEVNVGTDGDFGDQDAGETMTAEERRKANKQIAKNYAPDTGRHKKKKDPRIAKTKNRKRYKEAVKKVHSQVGTMRKELQKYSGESRGIRQFSLLKSVHSRSGYQRWTLRRNMSQNRSLGEGRICKMVKKCAYIIDERLGSVYFPIEAASISGPCSDLREKFTTDEEVIFTAQKHAQAQNDCQYVATSVVKKRELIPATGKICEIYDKYCYAEIKKYGRVFVPYSARNSFNKLNKPWLGYGAEIDKRIHLKIFPQPDIKNCRYVAWSIDMNVADEKKGYDKVHDTAKEQIGIIVICPAEGDLTVYSSQSGKACLPSSQREPWMQLGTCIRYDVVRQTDGGSRCTWVVKSVENLGLLYEIIVDNKDSSKLLLRLNAVVNRVSSGTYTAWLWNDVIGRIFVPSYQFKCRLRAMTCVEIVASWTGVFEDVPWTAVELEVLGDDTAIRTQNASLLLTDDNWTVSNIREVPSNGTNQTTFFGFINNPKYGSAFIAWTDLTKDDTPPVPEAKCRATVFFQSRSGKHCWRAVLVTPLSENGYPIWEHPLYNHSGQLTLPQPYQLPPPVLPKPAEQAPPNIVSPLPATLPEMDQTHDALFSAVTGSNDNGMAPMSPIITEPAELSPVARSFGTEGTNNYPNQVDLLDQLDLGMLAYASAIYSHSDNIWGPVKGLGTFGTMSMSDSLLPPPSGSSPSSPTSADATTQTDIMSEQEVLKDIMNNKELFSKVAECLSQPSYKRLMNIQWQRI
ncbi:hypothetical protein Q1695_013578 [Nippostrongylus brasiliensis]|nr:hypothetical protein Q1695_013578 [Nippostrongylus brasiliensis]